MTIARRLENKLSLFATHTDTRCSIPDVVYQLERICLASGTLLHEINQSVLHNTRLNYDSKRWLSEKEPKACLEVLQRMMNLAEANGPGPSVEKQVNHVTTLFDEEQTHFHLLLRKTSNM